MEFALLGDHRDGLDAARALVTRGHRLSVYLGPSLGWDYLRRYGLEPSRGNDLEDVLADPAIELVIVASGPSTRPAMLRRAVQSERHVLCVHPADSKPDVAFEAANVQAGTGRLLLPLLPDAYHPAIQRFAEILAERPVPWVLELDYQAVEEFLLESSGVGAATSVPGWDVLRRVGGDIVEVFAHGPAEELSAGQPLLVSGRFQKGGLFRSSFLAEQPEPRWRLAVTGPMALELLFPSGWPGPSRLRHADAFGMLHEVDYPTWSPWDEFAEALDEALRILPAPWAEGLPGDANEDSWTRPRADAALAGAVRAGEPNSRTPPPEMGSGTRLGWTDAIRALELDDAVGRSVRTRRAYTLDLQEASEETNFKGTMTLVGCSMMWITILLLFLSIWMPWAGVLIFPALALFLGLQLLRWIVPGKSDGLRG